MMVKVPNKSPLLLGKKLELQKEKINKSRNNTAKRIESEVKWPSPGSFFSINLKMLDHSPSLCSSSNSNLSETVKDILPNTLISPCEPVSNLTHTNKEKHLQTKDDLKETRKRLIYSPLKGTPPKRLRVENEDIDLESSFRFDNTMKKYLRPFDCSTPNQPKKKPLSPTSLPTSSTFDHHNNNTDIDFKRVAGNSVIQLRRSQRKSSEFINMNLSTMVDLCTNRSKIDKTAKKSDESLQLKANRNEVSIHKESAKNNKSKLNSNKTLSNQNEVSTPKESAKNNKSKLNSKSDDTKRTSNPNRKEASTHKESAKPILNSTNQNEVSTPIESAGNNKSKLNSSKRLSYQEEVLAPKESAKNNQKNKSKLNSKSDDIKRTSNPNEREVLTPKEFVKNNKSDSSISKSGDNKKTSKSYRRKKLCMPYRRRSEKACQTSKLNKTKITKEELEINKNKTKTESDYALNNESEVVKNVSKTKSKKKHILSERSNIQSENTKSNRSSGMELKNLTRTESDYAIDKQIIENMATDSDEYEDVNCASNSSKLKKKNKNILPKKSLPQNLLEPFVQNEDEQSLSKLPETVRVKMHGQNVMANLKLVLPVSEKWDKPSHNSAHVETIKYFTIFHFCHGQLKIKAFGEKGLQKSKCSALIFYVLFGNLEVTIHETTFSVGPGVNFLVPQGNVYNIVNRNNMEARLIYMQVNDPKEIN